MKHIFETKTCDILTPHVAPPPSKKNRKLPPPPQHYNHDMSYIHLKARQHYIHLHITQLESTLCWLFILSNTAPPPPPPQAHSSGHTPTGGRCRRRRNPPSRRDKLFSPIAVRGRGGRRGHLTSGGLWRPEVHFTRDGAVRYWDGDQRGVVDF